MCLCPDEESRFALEMLTYAKYILMTAMASFFFFFFLHQCYWNSYRVNTVILLCYTNEQEESLKISKTESTVVC